MILLGLDASASAESAALWKEGRLLASREWTGGRDRARPLFDALRDLLAATATPPAAVEAYAVGLGPGSFAGLRMAIACVQGMALPGARPVHGLPSALAAAARAAAETGRCRILVCGDGRRGRIWNGLFEIRDGLPEAEGGFRLDTPLELAARMPAGGAICTADWPALAAVLAPPAAAAGALLVERALAPHAVTLGEIALERIRRGIPPLPPVPLYLHPPVFVPPSFIEKKPQEPA